MVQMGFDLVFITSRSCKYLRPKWNLPWGLMKWCLTCVQFGKSSSEKTLNLLCEWTRRNRSQCPKCANVRTCEQLLKRAGGYLHTNASKIDMYSAVDLKIYTALFSSTL